MTKLPTFESLKFDVDADGIATITWDMPGRSMNVLSDVSIREYGAAIDRAVTDASIRGVVVTSAKKDFIAGADLPMLEALSAAAAKLEPVAAAQMVFDNIYALQTMLRRLEACGKPVACALPGTALGGGLEVALATHHRVVADRGGIQLGLPESKVGLMPGAGGTQRVVRIAGVMGAAPIILEGRSLDPAKALKVGIVNEVVAPDKVLDSARAWVKANLAEGDRYRAAVAAKDKKASASFAAPWDKPGYKLPGGGPFTPTGFPVFMGAGPMVRKATYGLYESQKAILSAVYEGVQVPFDTALKIEVRYFTKLVCGPQSRNMIRSLFVSKQALDKGARRAAGIPDQSVKKLGVLGGGGFMGAGIALVAAEAGIETVVLDRDDAAAAKGKAIIEKNLQGSVARGRKTAAAAAAVLARVTTGSDYHLLADCDLVIEAVFEDTAVKKAVIEQAEAHMKPDAIFASNTSTLPITQLARHSKRPEQFVGLHFFSPVDKMPLLEIIHGKQTGDRALAKSLDFARQLRKTPIVVNDGRFFYVNRCVLRFIEEAHYMLDEGVKPALIENAARMIGMPVGPLSLNDETALDLGLKIRRVTRAALGDKYVPNPAEARLDDMVEKLGRLGRKSGTGFYDYPKDGKKALWPGLTDMFPVADQQPDVEELKSRYLVVQAVEAVRAIEDGVVTDMREADVGAIMGFGFAPWSGGPISYIDTMGTKTFLAECDRLAARYGDRFKAPQLLREMAGKGETFYGRFATPQHAAA